MKARHLPFFADELVGLGAAALHERGLEEVHTLKKITILSDN
jgi:hypothetical protein